MDLHLFENASTVAALAVSVSPYYTAYELLPTVAAALLRVPHLETVGLPHSGGRAGLEAVRYHLQLLEQGLVGREPPVRVEPFDVAALEW